MRLVTFLSATALLSAFIPAHAAGPLGAADFQPTPQNPIGWRGDWTGRYPGATPPMEWSRRVKGITTELKYQAAKPSGAPGAEARPLEYFAIKDWLVLGPLDAADPKNIDTEAIPNEASIEPAANEQVAGHAWKPFHIAMDTQSSHVHNGGICRNLNVDFVYAFGKFSEAADGDKPWSNVNTKIEGDFSNKVAYAHSYVYSPVAATAGLQVSFAGAAIKAYVNGKPVKLNLDSWNLNPPQVQLAQGWNHVLVKVSTVEAIKDKAGKPTPSEWRFAAYLMPPSGTPVTYETKNVAWMTRVTGRSMSGPVVVGDKIFVGSGISDLMCFDKNTGKVLWIRANTPWDALTADEKGQYANVGEMVKQLNTLNDQAVVAINAMVSRTGMDSAQQAAMDKKLREKRDLENKIHKTFEGLDRRRFVALTSNEVTSSNATPCTDGQRVYWACGGGMKGPGASVIAAYDLSGKLVWSYHEPFGAAEHGLHTSPLLVDGKVVYHAYKTLIALDAATGKVAWKSKTEEVCGNNPQVTRLGEERVIVTYYPEIFRASDGAKLAANRWGYFGDTTPVIENGVMYNTSKFKNWGNYNIAFAAQPLPTNGGKFPADWEIGAKDAYMPLKGINYVVASPLYVDGIVYNMDMTGGFAAIDVKARKPLYRLWLDWYARYDRYLYGAVASPTLGGKNIYCVDDSGCTLIVQPGTAYKQLARNLIENIQWSGEGGNPCKVESFYTAPMFEGGSIYLKGEEYMYCIRGQ